MTNYVASRKPGITFEKALYDAYQHVVLATLIRAVVFPLQFDAQRKIVTLLAIAKPGKASVPCAQVQRHKLQQTPVTTNQQMCRYPETLYFAKVGMTTPIQVIGKQLLYKRAAKLARWQADAM